VCIYTITKSFGAKKDPALDGDLQELALCKELTQSLMGGGYGMCRLCD
jgi:hypothetical protein